MELTHQIVVLELALPWATSRTTAPGGLRRSQVVHVALRDERGLTGWGEAAPISRYGETAASASNFLRTIDVRRLATLRLDESVDYLAAAGVGEMAAKCAVETALLDLAGKQTDKPVYKLLGVAWPIARPISYTIGIGSVEHVREQVRRAELFQVLKLKLGGPNDEASVRAVREISPGKPMCVDANEGWRDREHALRMIEWLAADGRIEFIEQPLPARAPAADHRWLRERSPLPLFADESCHLLADLDCVAEGFHGVNVKLMKTGGLAMAGRTLRQARRLGLQTMLGCMIESSLGIAAAFQLSALADRLDLDSHALLANDPFEGLAVTNGCLGFAAESAAPGLGVRARNGSS